MTDRDSQKTLSALNMSPGEVGLYLPCDMEDNRNVIHVFDGTIRQPGRSGVFLGRVESSPITKWSNGRPRLLVFVSDGENSIGFSLFGDQRAFIESLDSDNEIAVKGIVVLHNGSVYLNDAKLIDKSALGIINPIYPGLKGKVSAQRVQNLIEDNLDIKASADLLREKLIDANLEGPVKKILSKSGLNLVNALQAVHKPQNINDARQAYTVLRRIECAYQASLALATGAGEPTLPISGVSESDILALAPFELTDEQRAAVLDCISRMRSGKKLRGMLIGDVGTGKTVVFGLVAAYVVSGEGRVAVMMPNETLAKQVYSELSELIPFANTVLVTGEERNSGYDNADLLVGTTALLFRDVGSLTLQIVDEQHKLGLAQREKLLSDNTHSIEASATPIPRSMAIAKYGAVDTLLLTKAHTKKSIQTELVTLDKAGWLMEQVQDTLTKGAKLLIVCPKKKDSGKAAEDMYSTERIANAMHAHFPGQVRMMNSEIDSESNAKSLHDIKEGVASILVATSMIEVGVTIPELRHLIVYGAERFGLTAIHQLRGRLARTPTAAGELNWGKCHLFIPGEKQPGEKTMQRLQILVNSNDGFEIAEADMRLRGVGDLHSDSISQHGDTHTLIRNVKIMPDALESAVNWLRSKGQK